MGFTADISKYIDTGVELAKKHPMSSTLLIVLVLFLIAVPMIGSNWLDFLKKLKDIRGQKGNFDMADLNKEQTRVMQNLALMSDNRTLPFEVRDWIDCKERTLKSLVKSGWLIRTERGYKVPSAVREVILKDEVPVEAVEHFLRFVADEEYFKDGEDYQALQLKLEIVNAVLKQVGDRLEENQNISALYTNLGNVYYNQGKYVQAEKYYQKALNIRLKVLEETHPDMAKSYNNLGCVYNNLGKYTQAEEYYQKALNIRLKVLEETHPDMAKSYNNLGVIYNHQGKYAQAEEYYKKALNIRLKVLGENHPDTAKSYYNLGYVYGEQGKYAQTEEYYQKALNIQLKVLGENHPDTAKSYNNLGNVYDDQGKYVQAEENHRRALEIRLKVMGEKHLDTARSYNNLGVVFGHQKKYNETVELYLKAWKIWRQKLGPEHPDTKLVIKNLRRIFPYIDHGDQDFDTWLSQQ